MNLRNFRLLPAWLLALGCLAAVAPAHATEFQVVSSSPHGCEFVYTPGALSTDRRELEGLAGHVRLSLPGASTYGRPGEPGVPIRYAYVAVPYGASYTVEVVPETAPTVQSLRVAPEPTPVVEGEPGSRDIRSYRNVALPEAYRSVAYSPAQVGEVSEEVNFRNQRTLRIAMHPVQVNPGMGLVRSFGALRVRVTWTGGDFQAGDPAQDSFESLYQRHMLNYDQARHFRRPVRPAFENPVLGENFFSASTGGWIRLRVRKRGIYEVGYADLQSAGYSAQELSGMDLSTLRVFTHATGGPALDETEDCDSCWYREVACQVRDAQGSTITSSHPFAAGDKVIFYGIGTEGFPEEFSPDTCAADTLPYVRNHYTDDNVYWITWGAGSRFSNPPARMAEVPSLATSEAVVTLASAPYRVHFEENRRFDPDTWNLGESFQDWERWWWDFYENQGTDGSGPQQYALPDAPFALPGIEAGRDAEVKFRLWGVGYGYAHYAQVSFAGSPIGEWYWYADRRLDGEALFPATPTNNRFILTVPGSGYKDQYYLAFFNVKYQRLFTPMDGAAFFRAPDSAVAAGYTLQGFSGQREVYSIRDVASVSRITGGSAGFFGELPSGRRSYMVVEPGAHLKVARIERTTYGRNTTWLKDTSRGADDILVSYDAFLPYARELADWRSGHLYGFQSPRILVAGIQQVYDEFGGGRLDPTALRNFSRYAFRHYQGAQFTYLTLLGDCNVDFKDYYHRSLNGDGVTVFVPMYENTYDTDAPPFQQFGTDDWFARLSGRTSLDIAVGRIPAATLDQARLLVRDKTIAYEKSPEFGSWRARYQLGADDNKLCQDPDGIGLLHTQQAEQQAQEFVPDDIEKLKVYLLEYPNATSGNTCNKPGAQKAFVDGMNEGALIVSFVGHGNPTQIANENLFSTPDLGSLRNRGRLWWFLMASCTVGKVDSPTQDGLAEAVMKLTNGGAVVALAATQKAIATESVPMQDSLLVAVFDTSDGRLGHPVGLATATAKLRFGSGATLLNNQKYVLQGDPALVLAAPTRKIRFDSPPDTLQQGQLVEIPFTVYRDFRSREVATDFNGVDSVEIEEAPVVRDLDTSLAGRQFFFANLPISYKLPGGTIFRGSGTVRNGRGVVRFVSPLSARLGAGTRVRVYAQDLTGKQDAVGTTAARMIQGDPSVSDSGPSIVVEFDRDARNVRPGSLLRVILRSPSGIYLGNSQVVNGILLSIDGGRRVVLNDFFHYFPDSFAAGRVEFPLPVLDPGTHTLTLSAASNQAFPVDGGRHRRTVTIPFAIAGGAVAEIRNVFNFPNPVRTEASTDLYFEFKDSGEATVSVFTVGGQRLRTFHVPHAGGQSRVSWDLRDDAGDFVSNGTYLFQVEIQDLSGQKSRAYGKIVVLRKG